MSRILKVIAVFLGAGVLLALDLVTKYLAETLLADRGIIKVVGDVAILVYAENEWAFLGLGASFSPLLWNTLFIILPIAFIALLLWIIATGKARGTLVKTAYILFVVGGTGNLFDRLFRNRLVRDFMNFGIGKLRTGILNIADLYVTAAAIMLIVWYIREEKAKKLQTPSGKK